MEEIQITIPDGWSDVTIGQYRDMDPKNIAETVCALWRIDMSTAESINMPLSQMLGYISFVTEEPEIEFKRELCDMSLVDLDSLTVGDLTELEELCEDFRKNVVRIAAWLYRNPNFDRTQREAMLEGSMTVPQINGAMSFVTLTTGHLIAGQKLTDMFATFADMVENPERLEMVVEAARPALQNN